jgi:hypothetical protein
VVMVAVGKNFCGQTFLTGQTFGRENFFENFYRANFFENFLRAKKLF